MGYTCLNGMNVSWPITHETAGEGCKLGMIEDGGSITSTDVMPRDGASQQCPPRIGFRGFS